MKVFIEVNGYPILIINKIAQQECNEEQSENKTQDNNKNVTKA